MATPTAPLAALTTVFTPPCATSWLLTTSKVPSQFPPFPTNGPSSCDPPQWASNIASRGFEYYSPAICPNGFEVGPNCQVTETRTSEGFPPVASGETAVYCVPSGHTCTTDLTDFRGGVWGFVADATGSGRQIATVGPAIQIRFRQEDLSILATHPLTPGLILAASTNTAAASISSTSGSSSTGTSRSSQVPTVESTGNGLSTIVSKAANPSTPRSTPASKSSNMTGLGPVSRSGSMGEAALTAVLVVSCLTGLILFMCAFVLMWRHRQKRAARDDDMRQVGVGVWVHKRSASGHNTLTSPRSPRRGVWDQPPTRDFVMQPSINPSELDPEPALGSKENPAELPVSTRSSWMSRASRFRQQLNQSRSSATRAESSMGDSRRTTFTGGFSHSRRFSGNSRGDFEAFARERWPNGLTVPGSARRHNDRFTMPPPPTRSTSTRSIPSFSDIHHQPHQQQSHHNNNRLSEASFLGGGAGGRMTQLSRISRETDGTFGNFPRSPVTPVPPVTPVSDIISDRISDRDRIDA